VGERAVTWRPRAASQRETNKRIITEARSSGQREFRGIFFYYSNKKEAEGAQEDAGACAS